ncbi:fimbrial biogenesis outer membrane usher protein [Roseomonas terrae]|uniref:Fimbrial biogenesis outer membrane usher protein n=1 Tax=Neoroseomonas terrae TaxID=424799 RepID=A0ABS5EH72_9PROT|nr:fimbria/pilus outer membrane usher protein [Neoroseomonas terrae]MBR0650384.1 fimbrial biogenesis outer membrane usher protein [Neoroseomonas terrae]
MRVVEAHGSAATALVSLLIAALLSLALHRDARAQDQTLLLEVMVNGVSIGKIGEFTYRDGALLARPEELRGLGFRVPDGVQPQADGLVPLAELSGITWRLDQPGQALHATARNESLLPALLRTGVTDGPDGVYASAVGATINYDVAAVSVDGSNTVTGLLDGRIFSRWGVLSSGMLGSTGNGYGGFDANRAIRLDSTYTYSDPAAMRQYRVGDFISGGLSWTRPIRMGGAQITSNFALRPDLVTFPLPAVGGTAAVPSTVDVLVNGVALLSREVQPGPFEIPQLPVVTGAGTVAMTVTNALGQQVVTTLPFYASSALLAPGLSTYSFEVGALRLNWSVESDDYGEVVGAATYRRGVSEMLTLEGHAEGGSDFAMGGGGFVINVGNLGVLNISAAASTAMGQTGTQIGIGIQRIAPRLSFGISAIFADRNFRDIASLNGDPVPRRQINASVGLSLGRYGSLGIAYAGIERDEAPLPIRFYAPPGTVVVNGQVQDQAGQVLVQPAQNAHVVSASYNVRVGDFTVYATGFRDFARGGGSGFLAGIAVPLGPRSSASVAGGANDGRAYGQVQASQTPVEVDQWGYQAYASAGYVDRAFADVQYRSPWGEVGVGVDRSDDQVAVRAQAQGALSFVDGSVFASNVINDSFAVVDTGGVGGVRVTSENRLVGRTGSGGRIIVPDLRSYDVNRIGIDPTDVPPDAVLPYTSREVRPQDRSGILLEFPLQASQGALLRLVDGAGDPLPVGSIASVQGGARVPVGYDGEAFLQGLDPIEHVVTVDAPSGRRCIARFTYRPVAGDIPTIGPLTCQDEAP